MSRSLLKKLTNQRLGALLLLTLLTATTAWADVKKLLALTADGQTISEATTWTNCVVSITGNSTVTFSERITISGTVTLNLGEGTTLTAPKGIEVDKGNTLTIEGNGALNATADKFYAAIGRGFHDSTSGTSGTININGGTITATGGRFAAAIGGGYEGVSGTINISGGTIVATGGYCAAGIGGGTFAKCGVVNISGGQVTANGDRASGIGPGFDAGTSGTVTLGWTNESDGILASNYNDVETLRVADGKAFTASTGNIYIGTLDDDQRAEFAGKTLVPAFVVNNAESIEHGTVAVDKAYWAAGQTVTLNITPAEGYSIGTVKYNDGTDHVITPTDNVYTFTMPSSNVTVSATFAMIIASVTVGETEAFYASVDAAVAAAKAAYVAAQGETAAVVPVLKLYDDINYGANSLQIGNGTDAFEMTLDLNGHRFYGDGAKCFNVGSNLIYIAPNAKLTVIDTSTGDTKGSIDCTKKYQTGIINKGTLTLNGGTIKYSGVQGTVVVNDAGLLTLNGATIIGKPTSGTVYATGILNAYGSACNIVSGSIEDCDIAIQNEWGDVNMSDGVITNCRYGIDLNHSEANTLIISGGTISNCSEEGIKLGDKGNLNMTALPVFSDNTTDIAIYDEKKVNFNEGTYAIPTSPIKIKVDYDGTDPYIFTEGYSANVKSGNSVIAFNDVFNVTVQNKAENAAFSFVGEGVIAAPKTFSFAESQVWSTWCDQYEWTKPEGIEVYDVTGVSNSNVSIQQLSATAIPAYKPVLLKKKDSGSLEATIAGVGTAPESYDSSVGVVTTTVGDATLVGATKQAMEWEMGGYYTYYKTYILYNNEFMLIYSNDGLAAHKFWINMDIDGAKDDDDKYCSRSLSIGGDGTTSLREVNSGEVNSEEWFSLDGRRLDSKPTKKGLYINNGKKIVIK